MIGGRRLPFRLVLFLLGVRFSVLLYMGPHCLVLLYYNMSPHFSLAFTTWVYISPVLLQQYVRSTLFIFVVYEDGDVRLARTRRDNPSCIDGYVVFFL